LFRPKRTIIFALWAAEEEVRVGGRYFAPEAWETLKAALPKAVLDDTVPNRGGPGGSAVGDDRRQDGF
jgi:Zn-dependent M28 family amino/carboxypeptidase